MAVIPRNYISLEKLDEEIERVKQKLGPGVFRVKHSVEPNEWDDPAIYFRIVLTDSAARRETLGEVTGKIRRILYDELRPIENWGMMLYTSFRSQSEQAMREGLEPAWSE